MLEGVLVAGIGATVALVLLLCFGNIAADAMPGAVYGHAKISLRADVRLAAFAIASALLVGVGFSILPALHASRFDPFAALKDPEGSAGTIERRWSLRNWLMVMQVAASLILLCGTGLCLRAISQQLRLDAGFRTDSIAVAAPDFERVGLT